MTSSVPSPSLTPENPGKSQFPSREKLTAACIMAIRDLVEGTRQSYKSIAAEIGVSVATVSRYAVQEGWQRPPGAAIPARIGTHRERVTQKLWKLTERHAKALEDQPIELAQRSLQPLARLTRVLGDIDKLNPSPARAESAPLPEPASGRSLHELRDELEAHLNRIMEEEGYGWEVREWWFENGGRI